MMRTWCLWLATFMLAAASPPQVLAGVEGVRQARDWQYAADMAATFDQPMIAYEFYRKIAEAFPETPHGRLALKREQTMGARALRPARSSAHGAPLMAEFRDFMTW